MLIRQIQLSGENRLGNQPEHRVDDDFNRRNADERTENRLHLAVRAAEQIEGETAARIEQNLHPRRGEIDRQHEENLREKLQREEREDARQLAVLGEQTADGAGEIRVQIAHGHPSQRDDRGQQKQREPAAAHHVAPVAQHIRQPRCAGRKRHQGRADGQKQERHQRRHDGGNQLGRDVLAHCRGQGELNVALLAEHAVKAVDVCEEADRQHRDEADGRCKGQQRAQPVKSGRADVDSRGNGGVERRQRAEHEHARADGQHGGKSLPEFNLEQFADHARNTSLKYSSTLHPCASRSSSTP